ncbi:MAG: nucleoside kinase [Lachnospiraceae bacterium]|nr:nucleoside kinase [Lachnospiraceae bacterium]
MNNITVSVMGCPPVEVIKGTTYEELSKKYAGMFKSPILLAKSGNRLKELSSPINEEEDIEFFDVTSDEGLRVHQRSVSFIMIRACKLLLGEDAHILVEHSLKKNLYCEIRKEGFVIDKVFLKQLDEKMRSFIEMDIPIVKEVFRRSEATEIVRRFGMEDKVRLFKYRRSSNITLYRMDNFYDYFYGYMAPSTGCIKVFELALCENGFIIKSPQRDNPQKVLHYVHPKKISKMLLEQMDWIDLMGISNVSDLNDAICEGRFGDIVRLNEALHEKKIAQIADEITSKISNLKLVLVSGPSSSGKTTFAHRLSVQLRVNGVNPYVISMDDYFINREDTPLDEFGKHDFENINALDISLFNSDIKKLIEGETVEMPTYNFVTGKREYKGKLMKLNKDEILIVEGIHGLNEELTEAIKCENKFKIYISAMTQLNIDDHNRISTSDSRLLRRIVRDYNFRGNKADVTIDTWPYVTRGEAKNIFPYQENADVVFNSATFYELSVLKPFVEPLLFSIDENMPEYITAKRLIKFLDYFLAGDYGQVPRNSILCEFIGGSVFCV